MKKSFRRLTAVLLAVILVTSVFSIIPAQAASDDNQSVCASSGTTGDCTWMLDDDGTLTISGNGKMGDYDSYDNYSPWGTSIKQVIINNGVTNIGEDAFYDCTSLESVTIPDSITSIGASAFRDCESLASISIPDSVTSIGNFAFFYCTGLESVTIPDSVTSIGRNVFYNTAWYNQQPDGLVYADKIAYVYKGNMPKNTSIVIKDGTKRIAGYAFEDCKNLASISIPDSVTSIGEWAFRGCTSLTGISIPDSVMSIGNSAFSYCTNLTSVTISNGVTSIGSGAFSSCKNLKSMTIPDSVTTIGSSAFDGCKNLKSITLPNNLLSIEMSTFFDCTSLESITLPDSLTSIGAFAFHNCLNLTSIVIPKSVTSIDDKALGFQEVEEDYYHYFVTIEGFAIYGYNGSEAERYAKDNDIEFIEIEASDEQIYEVGNYYLAGTIDGKDCGINNIQMAFKFSYVDGGYYNLEDVYLKKGDTVSVVRYLGNNQFVNAMKELEIYYTSYYNLNFKPYELGDPSYRYLSYSYSIYDPETSSTDFIVGTLYEDRTSSVFGDLNGDNSVDVLDATVVQKYSVGKENLSEDQLEVADVNNDNNVDILDATEIQKFAVGKITEFKKS